VKPDICSSFSGCRPPTNYCRNCSHAHFEGRATIKGRLYRWEFNPVFGPLFSRRDQGECDWTPHARHPVWAAFQRWHDRKFRKANAAADLRRKETP